MGSNVADEIASHDAVERHIAEEMALCELCGARQRTQQSVVRELRVCQDAKSRMEHRSDPVIPA